MESFVVKPSSRARRKSRLGYKGKKVSYKT